LDLNKKPDRIKNHVQFPVATRFLPVYIRSMDTMNDPTMNADKRPAPSGMQPIPASLPSAPRMYRALAGRDGSFEGIFVAGVKTTGIFCRPACTARTPKPENIEYFRSPREALLRGYRPCKICRPLGRKGEFPDWLKPLIDEIDADPSGRLRDGDLRARGLEPSRVRRWFLKNHGLTFQAYLRSLRIGKAFGRIRHGDRVSQAAFDSGYESLSGFTDSFKKTAGFAPRTSAREQVIAITRILTPLGPMFAGALKEGVCLLEFADRRTLETQLARLRRLYRSEIVAGDSPHFEVLSAQLEEYFAGRRREFSVPLASAGTAFQEKVWTVLRGIPYGTTRSYQEQARILGDPRAVRAVARANGDNRLAILVPCHRVIGKNGKLVGYGGGLWRKQYLLALERENALAAGPQAKRPW
jgi:AraC family transcriptional regulator of adaptative response/methylated-DNA-[protein]-cysteine methyltransferase